MSENEDKIKQLEEELRIAKLEKELAEAKAGNKEKEEQEQKAKEQADMEKRWAEHRKQKAKEAEEQKMGCIGVIFAILILGAFGLFVFLAFGGGITIDKQDDGSYCTTVNPIPDEEPVTYCGNSEEQVQTFKDCMTSAKTDFTMHMMAAANGVDAITGNYVEYCRPYDMWKKGTYTLPKQSNPNDQGAIYDSCQLGDLIGDNVDYIEYKGATIQFYTDEYTKDSATALAQACEAEGANTPDRLACCAAKKMFPGSTEPALY